MKRLLFLLSFFAAASAFAAETVEVWKDPNCGCCGLWVEHLQACRPAPRGWEAPASQPYSTLVFAANGATRAWQTHVPNDHLKEGKPR